MMKRISDLEMYVNRLTGVNKQLEKDNFDINATVNMLKTKNTKLTRNISDQNDSNAQLTKTISDLNN